MAVYSRRCKLCDSLLKLPSDFYSVVIGKVNRYKTIRALKVNLC